MFDQQVNITRRRFNRNWNKTNIYDQTDLQFCESFVLYERIDPMDISSPYYLKEFNFIHSHSLNMTISFPIMAQ